MQAALASANLRLHKVVSSPWAWWKPYRRKRLAENVRSLDLRQDNLPAQRSLGVLWDLETDAFTYRVSTSDKPLTRRGVLSVVNSVYDPLGLAAPVLLHGRLLLQQLVSMGKKKTATGPFGWDDPLPEELSLGWQGWKNAECLDTEMLPLAAIWSSYQSRITRIFRCKPRSHRCSCLSSPIQLQRRRFCTQCVRPG